MRRSTPGGNLYDISWEGTSCNVEYRGESVTMVRVIFTCGCDPKVGVKHKIPNIFDLATLATGRPTTGITVILEVDQK